MTVLEHLTKYYPLHVQRIVEAAVAHDGYEFTMRNMASRASVRELDCTFVWGYTPEGHEYWKALARAEDNAPHEIVI